MPGSIRSSRIRSGGFVWALRSPSCPSWATTVSYPWRCRLYVSTSVRPRSSSIIRMRGLAIGMGDTSIAGNVDTDILPLDCVRTMANDLAFHQVNDVLGNVGCMVGNALQMARRREERQTRLHHGRRGTHVRDELRNDLVVVTVHLVVEPADRPRLAGIEVYKGVQALPHHRRRQIRHALQPGRHRDRRL